MPDVAITITFDAAPCDITNCIRDALANKRLNILEEYFKKGMDDNIGIHYSVELFSGDMQKRPKPNTYLFEFSSKSGINNVDDYMGLPEKIKTSDAIVKFLNKNAEKR